MKALTLVHSFAMVLSTWVTMLAGIMMMSCKVPSGHIDEKASERCFWPIYLRSNVRELAPIDAYSAWLITRGGALLYTSDGGKNWEPIAKGIKDNITDASFINLYQGWILSNKGEIWKTVNAGVNWMKLETLTIVDHDYAQIHFIDADHGWVIDQTVIWLTRDGGFTWGKHKIAISPLAPRVFALDFISPLRGWLCGEGGMLYRTLDGGISWQTVKVSDEDTIFDNIVFTSNSRGWAYGFPGGLYRTDDGGVTWVSQDIQAFADGGSALSVHFISEANGWMAGIRGDNSFREKRGGTVLYTLDGGEHWQQLDMPDNELCYFKVQFWGTSFGWVCSEDRVYRTEDGGHSWEVVLAISSIETVVNDD